MDEIQRFPTEVGISEKRKNPILLHRLASDQLRCYKFVRKGFARNGVAHKYECYCCKSTKRLFDGYENNPVPTILVSNNNANFMKDPESIAHFCGGTEYAAEVGQQECRFVLFN